MTTTNLTKHELRQKSGQAYGKWYWAKAWGKAQAEIVGHILDYRKFRAETPNGLDETNKHGNTVFRDQFVHQQLGIICGDASSYDVKLSNDWESHATWQNAEYFGVWVNRTQRMILTYCEGDRTLVVCPTEEQLLQEYNEMREFYAREQETNS